LNLEPHPPRPGIISAFAPEVQAVLERMTKILGKKVYAGRAFFIGELKRKTVAVTTCG
jgi:nucleoside phosphorylase